MLLFSLFFHHYIVETSLCVRSLIFSVHVRTTAIALVNILHELIRMQLVCDVAARLAFSCCAPDGPRTAAQSDTNRCSRFCESLNILIVYVDQQFVVPINYL